MQKLNQIPPNPHTKQQLRLQKTNSIKLKTHKSIIKSGNKNKLPIGRKLSKRNRRHIIIINQSLQQRPGRRIPNLTRPVMTPGDNQRAISVEMRRRHRHRMRPDHVHRPPRLHIPNPNRIVEGSGDNQIGLRIEIDAENPIGVALERLDALGVAHEPDAEGAVVGGGADVGGVGGPGEVADALGVAD